MPTIGTHGNPGPCNKRTLAHFGKDATDSAIAHNQICGPSFMTFWKSG
ncbi:hypothetical protein SAMN05216228_101689 [Rhizobium tibeticum]|uniref:Uncharacterized protein n=1 Tax=Rhizobium tibeticum TaxID=501024 RepID=A0A1H8PA19_9HYPH|nr:hypothetical protein RTCCBAU85039_3796 [Rhizobium tibeticum]SEO38762.1 hypothetical protein SAMN05216228_101689 [Rhizobium tibeticum]